MCIKFEYNSSLDKVNYIMMHKNKHTLDIRV